MLVRILIKKKPDTGDLPLPSYFSDGSSGMDIRAAVKDKVDVNKGEIILVPTGLFMPIPEGYEIQIRPRSGLALQHGMFVLNSPGTIDSDYRGEVSIIMANFGEKKFTIKRGDRIAQLVVQKVEKCVFIESDKLPETIRGDGGFGHSGHKG